jgi:acyl-CoA thioester hydrolase
LPDTFVHEIQLRIRYGETDQMGTFYNAAALDWFECGRTEALRAAGMAYREMESRGVMLPVVEANVKYLGKASYDDLLTIRTTLHRPQGVRIRCDERITIAGTDTPIVTGFTLHAIVDARGRPIRPPTWMLEGLHFGEAG